MKKLLTALALILTGLVVNAQNPDCLIDSIRIVSPYWGLQFQTGTVQDTFMNCGSSNTNFVPGTTYKLLKFPFGLANMGNDMAYFGRYGVNGVTHDRCYSPQYTSPTDFINIPNFNKFYLLDSCKNIITWNSKTDFNIQNSQYAMGVGSISYPNQVVFYSQYFPAVNTIGSQPNILKDWLESKCGPLDTNMARYGFEMLDNYSRDCQICDSLILFPNFASWDDAYLQLPNNLGPGNYYLAVSCNFYMMNQGSNCYPDSLVIPFHWDGSFGLSTTFPYLANGVTFLNNNSISCTQPIAPVVSTNLDANSNGTSTTVTWSNTGSYTSFEIVPIYVQGNTERRIVNRAVTTSSLNYSFNNQTLIQDARALGAGNGMVKYRFGITTINNGLRSGEVKTKSTNIK